jgi:DeoR family glycerol-3-phosphate regulon repressor
VASQIPNGATLFIDIGTTPEAVAHALLDHENLRVVTNNLNVANTLMQKDDFRIILAGELRSRDGGIIGEATLDFISQFRLDFGILASAASTATARCWSLIITKCAPSARSLKTHAT